MKSPSAIFTRRSIRAYDISKRADKIQIEDVLNAAMHAPTAMGKEPWRFIAATDADALDKIVSILPHAAFVKEAGTGIIVCGDLDAQFKSDAGGYYPYDCSAAAQNLMLRAKEIGLGTCWCAIAPEKQWIDAFKKAFSMPENIEPMALIVLGSPAEFPELESPRYSASKVHWQSW